MRKGFFYQTLTNSGRRRFLEVMAATNCTLTLDANYLILAVNPDLEKLLGVATAVLVGKSFFKIFVAAEADGAEVEKQLVESLRKGAFAIRGWRVTTADGRRLYVNTRLYNLGELREKAKYVVLCSNMTAQYASESGQRSRVEAIDRSYAFVEFDMEGKITNVNDMFCQAMGYSRAELIGSLHRSLATADIIPDPEYRQFWQDLRSGQTKIGDFERKRRGGQSIFLQASYTPVKDPTGVVIKIIKIGSDITQRVMERQKADKVAREVDVKLEEIVEAVASANERSASASTAAAETSSMVQNAADAIGDFETSSRRIADAMIRSRDAVGNVKREANAGDNHIGELSNAANSMTSIVEIIQKVAGQINLLALNATIEAARAGEAGKGFAVVASEVKSLADQVERSTNQISADISRVQRVSGEVVGVLRGISSAVRLVEDSVIVAGSAVEEQSTAARDIATGMQQAAVSVRAINDNLGSGLISNN